jgi:hypothetical protein
VRRIRLAVSGNAAEAEVSGLFFHREPGPPNDFPPWLGVVTLAFIVSMAIMCVIAEVRK